MNETLLNTDGLGNAMIYIADKIGMTLEQVYYVYLQAQFVMATVQIVMTVICFALFFITFIYLYRREEKRSDNRVDIDDIFGIVIVSAIITIFPLLLCVALYTPIIAMFCPEYTALNSLMNDIGHLASVLK